MRNPWLDLPQSPPFVLPQDAETIAAFNRRARANASVHTELLPEPFLGAPDAPIVLLGLNPGFNPADARFHADSACVALSRANLAHASPTHPFYLLDPSHDSPGRHWWDRRLGPMLEAADRAVVSNRVLCVEYFGYHSDVFRHHRLQVPSQQYGFHLVRRAVERGAVVVLMRGRKLWRAAVPELERYSRLHTLRSVQNTTISARNCPTGFAAIRAVLTAPG